MVKLKNYLLKSDRGFTFIEILLYISIVVFLMGTLMQFGISVISNGAKNSTQQEVYEAARYISERLKYEIRNAVDINTGSSNFSSNLAQNAGQKLSLKGVAPNDPLLIDVQGGKARITAGTNSPVVLNSADTAVTNLTFTNLSSLDSKTKHIVFTLTVIANYNSTRQEYKESITIESSAELRSN